MRQDDFNDIFNQFFNEFPDSARGYEQRKYFVNGREVTPEQLQQLKQSKELENATSQQGISNENDSLDKLGRNLTQEARDGLLDEIIGREKEIQKTAEILSRRIKNNPILVGDAGVGKTAIVEGLAQAIVNGKVPASIQDKEIYSINISNLEAGTQYRGSFEENIKNLIDDVQKRGNVILFFDEIHQILGAGSIGGDSGSKGLADIIKPYLGRSELSLIGATTQDEYRNTILKNAALARRFNEVKVLEPSKEECFLILKGISHLYEKHHNVLISDEVIRAAIDYSVQYIPQKLLPDKAIDLIDMTAAHISAKQPVYNKKQLENDIARAIQEKNKAVAEENFNLADNLVNQINELKKQIEEIDENNKPIELTPHDVAYSVERLTGIPVSQMSSNDIEKLKEMDQRLKKKIIGQDEAVQLVSRAIRRNRAGFDDGLRPIGSFLFTGPTGVGKTELAKQLAYDMFGDKEAIIRLDMSEYTDKTAISKLIGTSAGYIGYDDNSNTLTEQVRRNPYSIVLFDEIEKADPGVITLLLQVLDDGRLTDGQGNVIDFKNTVIIATTNAGYGSASSLNDDEEQLPIEEKLAFYFRPEFLNRFNGIIEFNALTPEDLSDIFNLMISDVNLTLEKKGITLTVTAEAEDYLIEKGYNKELGARPLRRIIEQEIRDKITDFYLENQNINALEAYYDEDSAEIKIREI